MSAIKAAIINVIGDTYENMSIREVMRGSDAILSALDAAGYAVVPVKPTEAMRIAAVCTQPPEFVGDYPLYEKCWRAMLTAAKENK